MANESNGKKKSGGVMDRELLAMKRVSHILSGLDLRAKRRVVAWLADRHGEAEETAAAATKALFDSMTDEDTER